MAELNFAIAQNLAGALVTIGHPWSDKAINATALDLVTWCKGYFNEGSATTPEEQAETLIGYVRLNWDEWPEKGGTKLLRAAFDKLFPVKVSQAPPVDTAQLTARGVLAAPCCHCEPGSEFCEYGGPRAHKHYLEEIAALTPDTRSQETPRGFAPVVKITAADFQRAAKRVYRDEQQRKIQQVAEVEEQQERNAS